MKRETKIVILGAVVGLTALAALLMPVEKAEAFFGDSDSNDNWLSDGNGALVSDASGYGKGKGSAEGNFSMTINASGKATSEMRSDVDGSMDGRGKNYVNGVTHND